MSRWWWFYCITTVTICPARFARLYEKFFLNVRLKDPKKSPWDSGSQGWGVDSSSYYSFFSHINPNSATPVSEKLTLLLICHIRPCMHDVATQPRNTASGSIDPTRGNKLLNFYSQSCTAFYFSRQRAIYNPISSNGSAQHTCKLIYPGQPDWCDFERSKLVY